jgi:hypothetical protein
MVALCVANLRKIPNFGADLTEEGTCQSYQYLGFCPLLG